MICRRNAPALDVDNGTTSGVITDVDHNAGAIVVRTLAGSRRTLPARYSTEHLEHAYALTAHAMQGATVEWAAAVGAPGEFTRNWSYTALFRGRAPTKLFVAAPSRRYTAERAEIAPSEPKTRREPLHTVNQTMRRRDDEDLALDRHVAFHHAPPARARVNEARDRGQRREGHAIDLA